MLLTAGFVYETCAAKCRKKKLTSKRNGFHQTTTQASGDSHRQLMKCISYLNNERMRRFFFSLLDVPLALGTSLEGGLGEDFYLDFSHLGKLFVLCVKKEQLCTCIRLFGTFFQAIFLWRTTWKHDDNFFHPRSLFLKIAAFYLRMLNKQDKIWEDTNSAYLVKFFTSIASWLL